MNKIMKVESVEKYISNLIELINNERKAEISAMRNTIKS